MIHVWNENVYLLLNSLSGRSFMIDALIAMAIVDPVLKAGPIVAAWVFAWFQCPKSTIDGEQFKRRKRLLITLCALFLIAPLMKLYSTENFSPRPMVQSEQTYAYAGGGLTELPKLTYNAPLTGEARQRHQDLISGEMLSNDFRSFPSDHAALFLALSFGILLAARIPGLIALGWALMVTLGSRVITGMHSPLDIIAGGAAGIALLLIIFGVMRFLPARLFDFIFSTIDRFPAWAGGLAILALLEVTNAFDASKRLLELGTAFLGNFL